MKRRNFIETGVITTAVTASGLLAFNSCSTQKEERKTSAMLNNNINHSICQWCYGDMELEDLLVAIKKIGLSAIDLIGPKDWPLLKKHEVECSMCNGAEISLTEGWNDPQYHRELIESYRKHIDLVSKAGYKNLICFSGNRKGMDDKVGLQNCVNGLKEIIPYAEEKNVVIQMELFNTKVDHPDYMCDSTPWGIELVDKLGSDHFKLLYDIYHMQVQEGNIIQTIKDYHTYFGHYHTAGVPGRNEIDESQELYYPAVMEAILETGFNGFVAQEFIPTADNKLKSLEEAIHICDV